MRSKEEIITVIRDNKPLFSCDVMRVSIFELACFCSWEELPDSYKTFLEKGKVTSKNWGSDVELLTEEDLHEDIKDELRYLECILDVEDFPAVWRFPRIMALLWYRNKSGDTEKLERLDTAIVTAIKKGLTLKKVKNLYKMLSEIV